MTCSAVTSSNIQDDLTSRQANIINYRAPSYGLFKNSLQPQYWFGIPRNVNVDRCHQKNQPAENKGYFPAIHCSYPLSFSKIDRCRVSIGFLRCAECDVVPLLLMLFL